MPRLIDADEYDLELIKELMKRDEGSWGYRLFEAIRTDLKNRPTVDAVPIVYTDFVDEGEVFVNAKISFLNDSAETSLKWRCSNCRYWLYSPTKPNINYCPMCGAKKRKTEEQNARQG